MTKKIKINGILYNKNHLCKHCGKRILYPTTVSGLNNHKYRGIPRYIDGHNPPSSKYGYKKGQCGKNHPAWIDGCGEERKRAIYNSSVRRFPYPSFLNEPFKGASPHHIDMETVAFIPRKLHFSIQHSVKSGKNMKKINKLALEFISIEAYRKYGKHR